MDIGITFIASVIGSLVLSVAGNFLSDWFKNWLGRRSLTQNQKNLKRLEKRLEKVTMFAKDQNKLSLELWRVTIGIILTFSIGLAGGICGTAFYIMGTNPPPFLLEDTSILGYTSPEIVELGWSVYSIAMMVCVLAGAVFIYIGTTLSVDYLLLTTEILDFEKFTQETSKKIEELKKVQQANT